MISPADCPLCGAALDDPLIESSEYAIQRCRACTLAVTVPASYVSRSEYTEQPQYADAYAGQEVKFRGYARHLLDWAQRHVRRGRLLDVGCSVGLLVDEARLAGFDSAGIDLDRNAVDYARGQGRPVTLAAIADWPARDYDCITLSHTLEHVPEPISFLETCAARLKPGGCLVIAVPCFCGLHPRLYRDRWYGWLPHQHYFHYSPAGLQRLFTAAGLDTAGIWQEAMDHRPPFACMRRRDMPLAVLSWGIARLGAALGQGDQLIGIARKPASP